MLESREHGQRKIKEASQIRKILEMHKVVEIMNR